MSKDAFKELVMKRDEKTMKYLIEAVEAKGMYSIEYILLILKYAC